MIEDALFVASVVIVFASALAWARWQAKMTVRELSRVVEAEAKLAETMEKHRAWEKRYSEEI